MFASGCEEGQTQTQPGYDRKSELISFDQSEAGVKGLVDAGLTKIPRIFIHESSQLLHETSSASAGSQLAVPIIDFAGAATAQRGEIIERVRDASEKWGFFQIVNHAIPVSVLDEVIDGVRRFHEQDSAVKKRFYSRDVTQKCIYNSNSDLFKAPATCWRDTLSCTLAPEPPKPEQLPAVCRDILMEYAKNMMELCPILLEVFSEALGLNSDHLKGMDCGEGLYMMGHYYPPCPEPELTLGTSSHTDSSFFTVLLQDQIGGLQIHHQNQWIDVPPLRGALVVNLGDLMQLITNDKFKSVNHRVLAKSTGPRVSVASFFRTHFGDGASSRVYGPIKELLSEANPPIYRDATIKEFIKQRYNKAIGTSTLSLFKL